MISAKNLFQFNYVKSLLSNVVPDLRKKGNKEKRNSTLRTRAVYLNDQLIIHVV